MHETILVQQKGVVASIILNRPETGNAFVINTFFEISKAVERLSADDSVRVVIITGAGGNFSTGGDINLFKRNVESATPESKESIFSISAMGISIRLCSKPVVAMINGYAMGAGCALACACDFRVMSASSRMGTGFVNMGLSGDSGGYYYLQRLVGIAKATELMALGTIINGEEAFRLGLTTRFSENDDKLKATTDALVNTLVSKAPLAFAMQKRLAYEFFHRDLQQYLLREADYMAASMLTEDHKEGVNAFLEKRTPKFVGR
jgi:2-(1,2-epoxy-1,2-dihydrophenyl)acetyl-CoA isomerase